VLDSPWVYLVLGLVGAAALVYRGWELWMVGYIPLPQQSPGVALAAVGVALVLYGAGSGFGVSRRY
jgi:threonine/homoserine/homoserine lactone efflux protein